MLLIYLYFLTWFGSYFYLFHLDDCLDTCSVVIMEGDPHPGAIKGRMSFQSFNPSIDVSIKVKWSENFYNDFSPPISFGFSVLLMQSLCHGRNWVRQQQTQSLPLLLAVKVEEYLLGGLTFKLSYVFVMLVPYTHFAKNVSNCF